MARQITAIAVSEENATPGVAEEVGATHVLVLDGSTPSALIPREEFEATKLDEARGSLQPESLDLDVPEVGEVSLPVYYDRNSVVVLQDQKAFVMRSDDALRGPGDVKNLLNKPLLAFAAHDIEVPGIKRPIPPQEVTYRCKQGHRITQLDTDPNRVCPIDKTALTR